MQVPKTKNDPSALALEQVPKTKSDPSAFALVQVPKTKNDPSALALESGCSKDHCNMAATLLVSRPGHDAATPTCERQGSWVSATALPIAAGLLRPRAMAFT